VSFVVTLVVAVAVTWVSLGVAYYSVYPVGFYVSTFGFAVYLVAAGGRAVASRVQSRTPLRPRLAAGAAAPVTGGSGG
jgi:zinc/manganese transport system permease protein